MKRYIIVQNFVTLGDSFEKFMDILKEKGITEEVTSFMVFYFEPEKRLFLIMVEIK